MKLEAAFLTDPSGFPLFSGLRWFEGVLLGPVGSAVAVISVASFGALMLSGRVDLRRGGTIILGCFMLFGATGIAAALRDLAGLATPASSIGEIQPFNEHDNVIEPSAPVAAVADPYAGASVPQKR